MQICSVTSYIILHFLHLRSHKEQSCDTKPKRGTAQRRMGWRGAAFPEVILTHVGSGWCTSNWIVSFFSYCSSCSHCVHSFNPSSTAHHKSRDNSQRFHWSVAVLAEHHVEKSWKEWGHNNYVLLTLGFGHFSLFFCITLDELNRL